MVLAKIILSKEDISMSHAPNSPDPNLEDYDIWLEMWQRVQKTKFHNVRQLDQHMRHGLKQSVIDDAFGHQLHVIDDVQLMSVVNVPVHVFV